MIQTFAATECAIGGGRHGFPHGRVGDADRPTCPDCYSRAKESDGTGAFDGLQCLHLCAMEMENRTPSGSSASWADRALRQRLRKNFEAGVYRARCGCLTCVSVRAGEFRAIGVEAIELRHAVERARRDPLGGGVIVGDDLAPSFVRALPENVAVSVGGVLYGDRRDAADALVMVNREVTRRPLVDAELSGKAVPAQAAEWVWNGLLERQEYRVVDQHERQCRDDLARAWFRDMAQSYPEDWHRCLLRDVARRRPWCAVYPSLHPVGYYDGRFWVDPEGECHDLTGVLDAG